VQQGTCWGEILVIRVTHLGHVMLSEMHWK